MTNPRFRVGSHSPVNIWEADVQWAMAITPHKAGELVRLANIGNEASAALSHHLDAGTDPCKDRGVDWPCDVAAALGEDSE